MASGQRNRAIQPVNTAAVEVFQWPTAYHHAAQMAVERAFDEATLNAAFRSGITSHVTTVTDIVRPEFRIGMNQGQLILSLANASVSVKHQRRHENFEEDFVKRVSGSLEMSIEVIQPDPRYDPFCSVDMDLVDLQFTVTPRACVQFGNNCNIHIGNGSVIINGGTGSFNLFGPGTHVSFGPGTHVSFGPGTHVSFGPGNHQSTWQSAASPQNAVEAYRPRPNVAPTVYKGINQTVRSSDDYASIVCKGINSRILSSGREAEIVSKGVNSDIISYGPNAAITSKGTSGSITSSGSNARIRDQGTSGRVDSSGPNASIRCSGTSISINSSGSNAVIESSGTSSSIRSTGSNASISFSGTNIHIQSSGTAIKDDFAQTLIRALTDAIAESLNGNLRDNSLSRDLVQRSL